MELTEFPLGNKSYKITDTSVASRLNALMDAPMFKTARELHELVKLYQGKNNDTLTHMSWGTNYTQLAKLISESPTPIYQMTDNRCLFTAIEDSVYSCQMYRAPLYQACIRYKVMDNMPHVDGVRFSVSKTHVKLYNIPYEGELIKTKEYTNVNRVIKDKCAELAGVVKMQCVISGGKMVAPEGVSAYMSTDELAEKLYPAIEAYIMGTATMEEEFIAAIGLGSATAVRNWQDRTTYILIKEDKKPKFPTGIRTRLQYRLGAMTHPENYKEWFDD